MANKRITNMDIRKVLELYLNGNSIRELNRMLKIHRNTLRKYIEMAKSRKLSLASLSFMTDKDLDKLFLSFEYEKTDHVNELDQFLMSHESLQKLKGFTVKNLYGIYKEEYTIGLGRSQFYSYFKRKYKAETGSLKFNHFYGDKLYVDFAGDKLHYIDKDSGEVIEVEVFVGILPASNYLFVEAVHSQKIGDFIHCTAQNLAYIGGVPRCIVMDNLKSAVTKAKKFEPVLNSTFKDLAHHYQCVAMPTRTYSPKDKAMVEGAVKIVRDALYLDINRSEYYSLRELNIALKEGLEKLNQRPLTHSTESRRDQFAEEKKSLAPLPINAFEVWEYKQHHVQKMGYIFLSAFKNYYSVPYRFIGKQVKVRYNTHSVECYYNNECIARHRLSIKPNYYTTIRDHLHSSNQFYADWCPEKFIKMAREKVGDNTSAYVTKMIDRSTYPETSYRSALAIIALANKFPTSRIERVCELAMDAVYMNCGILQSMLEHNRDRISIDALSLQEAMTIPIHNNIRGAIHYQ
jgi:transposase